MTGGYFNETDRNRHRVNIALMTLTKSVGQRSRLASDGRRNLVNAIAPEPLKRFRPKHTQIFPILGPRTDWVYKVIGSKVKVTRCFSAEAHQSGYASASGDFLPRPLCT